VAAAVVTSGSGFDRVDDLHIRFVRDAEDIPLEKLARMGSALFQHGLTSPEYLEERESLTVTQAIGVLIWFRW
jgi:hypothetical protein